MDRVLNSLKDKFRRKSSEQSRVGNVRSSSNNPPNYVPAHSPSIEIVDREEELGEDCYPVELSMVPGRIQRQETVRINCGLGQELETRVLVHETPETVLHGDGGRAQLDLVIPETPGESTYNMYKSLDSGRVIGKGMGKSVSFSQESPDIFSINHWITSTPAPNQASHYTSPTNGQNKFGIETITVAPGQDEIGISPTHREKIDEFLAMHRVTTPSNRVPREEFRQSYSNSSQYSGQANRKVENSTSTSTPVIPPGTPITDIQAGTSRSMFTQPLQYSGSTHTSQQYTRLPSNRGVEHNPGVRDNTC